MNRPLVALSNSACGRRGIRTPGTVNPYGSLANCWFQPLTHPSRGIALIAKHCFSNACAKVVVLSDTCKFFLHFFSIFFIISVGIVPTVLTMSVASSVAEVCSVKAVALVSDTKAMLRHARVGHGKGKGILKGKKAKE